MVRKDYSRSSFVEPFYSGVFPMANRSLFRSLLSRFRKTDATNEAGGSAYQLEVRHALAQLAATGAFGGAFYTTAEEQLETPCLRRSRAS
jgi:hypothetical protein